MRKYILPLCFSICLSLSQTKASLANSPEQIMHGDGFFTITQGEQEAICPSTLPAITIETQKNTFSTEAPIEKQLQQHGLLYNSDILLMLYELNPKLADIKALHNGESVILPVVKDYPNVKYKIGNNEEESTDLTGCLVQFRAYPQLKQQIKITSDRLIGWRSRFHAGKIVYFPNPGVQGNAIAAIESLSKIEKLLSGNVLPFNYETLRELDTQGDTLLKILQKPTSAISPMSKGDAEAIQWYRDEFKFKLDFYNNALATAEPHKAFQDGLIPVSYIDPILNYFLKPKRLAIQVNVYTFFSKSPLKPASDIRVYYRSTADKSDTLPFAGLTDRNGLVSDFITVGHQYDFLAKDDNKKYYSEPLTQQFASDEAVHANIELLVKKMPPKR